MTHRCSQKLFRSITSHAEEELPLMDITIALNEISTYAQGTLSHCYTELLKIGNSQFILLWQKNSSFLAGLSPSKALELYKKAQLSYRAQFGAVHTGQCQVSFSTPHLKTTSEWDHSSGDSRLGRVFDGDTITDSQERKKAETQWKELLKMGDSFVAWQLAKSFFHSDSVHDKEKATYYFGKYKTLAPHLPFGTLEDIAVERRSCIGS